MPLARIITNNSENARILFRRLEAYGYTTEIVRPFEKRESAADLEIELERMEPREALAKAARMSQGKQVNVLVAVDCVGHQSSETERVALSERLIETAEQARSNEPIPVAQDGVPRIGHAVSIRTRVAAIAISARHRLQVLAASGSDLLQRVRIRTAALAASLKQDVTSNATFVGRKWQILRKQQGLAAERRREARLERIKEAELQRSRRLLQEQEELRHTMARKRHADEERERHLQLQEQLRRIEQAQQAERQQREREAQLERQRLEALRLAEERERLVRERAERELAAEQARRVQAQEASRRQQEKEHETLLAPMEFVETNTDDQNMEPVREIGPDVDLSSTSPGGLVEDEHVDSNLDDVRVAPAVVERTRKRWEGDVNSPYHPGWTWAAATAGAVTVGVMLLWTAWGSRHPSTVQLAPLSPSSFLPARASQVEQQVPFGPVKVVVQKTRTAPAAVPVIVPAMVAPEKNPANPPVPAHVLPKPLAARSQVVNSGAQTSEDTEPDVVVRHLAPAVKSRVPEAGQTATIKRYSDLN